MRSRAAAAACVLLFAVVLVFAATVGNAWIISPISRSSSGQRPSLFSWMMRHRLIRTQQGRRRSTRTLLSASSFPVQDNESSDDEKKKTKTMKTKTKKKKKRRIAIIGAGWAGLSAAHALSKQREHDASNNIEVTVIEASPRVGGLVRDGFTTISGKRQAEAGQHGFWDNYRNIFRLLKSGEIQGGFNVKTALTDYAEQGQYSKELGLEAVWPIYRDQPVQLPTGLAQAAYTRFFNLPWYDRITALPMVLAFSDFDDSEQAWQAYDDVSFRDLCIRLGVSRRCYEEAFEPMLLTGLFAPGAECSAAAALGMAYFFVLQSQKAFDVNWCRGNIGQVIFDPWVETMKEAGVNFQCKTRVTGFEFDDYDDNDDNNAKNSSDSSKKRRVTKIQCTDKDGVKSTRQVDDVVFAVGAKALNAFVRFCPELAQFKEFQGFANLRGISVLATRIFLDRNVTVPYTANACWGFDKGVGMTFFDITAIQGRNATDNSLGSVIEVDYYHAATLLVMTDNDIVAKVKRDLDTILGPTCESASVVDAAVVRLPDAVNWYFPGSYKGMPQLQSLAVSNVYFAGDIVRTRHGSWSQEKAFVTGLEVANVLMNKPLDDGILPVAADEIHVKLGRDIVSAFKKLVGSANKSERAPSLVDFFW